MYHLVREPTNSHLVACTYMYNIMFFDLAHILEAQEYFMKILLHMKKM